MEHERTEWVWLVRLSRRRQGLTQEALARRVGISKGALSRYESGDTGVLGDATVRALSEALGLSLPAWLTGVPSAPAGSGSEAAAEETTPHCCPAPFCPQNQAFVMPGTVRFVPRLLACRAGVETLCRYCGATLLDGCPQCGSGLVADHGVCPQCGTDYIPAVHLDETAWRLLEYNAGVRAGGAFAAPARRRGGPLEPGGPNLAVPEAGASAAVLRPEILRHGSPA